MWPMQKGISSYALIDNLWTEFGSISWKKEEFFHFVTKVSELHSTNCHSSLGASAYVQLQLQAEAIQWCKKGLSVSFV